MAVRPKGGLWGVHSALGLLNLLATAAFVVDLASFDFGAYPLGLPRLLDLERDFGIGGYRLLLWSSLALALSGLLRLPDNDPEVRKNFFRFQACAALWGAFAVETELLRRGAPVDVFDGGPACWIFVSLSAGCFAMSLYWMYTIVAASQGDNKVIAGVATDAPKTAVAASFGPLIGGCGLWMPQLLELASGREAKAAYFAAQPSHQFATLNATIGLILVGNIAVFCLTATRRRWLTDSQARPVMLGSFLLCLYDQIMYALDAERQSLVGALYSRGWDLACDLYLPEAAALGVAGAVGAALARRAGH